jgi:ABC-2 type transport system permease protein
MSKRGRPPVSERATGNIYDLGYRNYEGARLGRPQAVLTLYFHSVRASFGVGRRTVSKVFPIGFAIVAFIPALVQLGIGAFTSSVDADIELIAHEDYYGFVQIILLLFCATTAPELAGRDQRTRTLSLYFSRALRREDYALAKLAALVTAMLVLTLGPQALLYIGNGLAEDDVWGYISDEWDLIGPIVISALFLSSIIAAIGLAIGAYVPRRSYATVAILAAFIIPFTMAGILTDSTDPNVFRWGLLLSPFLFEGSVLWLFREDFVEEYLVDAGFHGSLYFIAGLAWLGAGTGFLVRRFQRVAA